METQQLIPLLIAAVVLPLLILKNRKARPLHPGRLWILPTLITALIVFGIWGLWMSETEAGTRAVHFGWLDWLILPIGLALGAAVGWQRGATTTIERRPDDSLAAKASPLGLIILVGLFIVRRAAEPWLEAHAGDWHVSPLAIQDAFMLFVIGLVVLQRVEMYLRARRIRAGEADAHLTPTAAG